MTIYPTNRVKYKRLRKIFAWLNTKKVISIYEVLGHINIYYFTVSQIFRHRISNELLRINPQWKPPTSFYFNDYEATMALLFIVRQYAYETFEEII